MRVTPIPSVQDYQDIRLDWLLKEQTIKGEVENWRMDEKDINPNYSSESAANWMNVQWTVRCSSGNPDLEIPNFGECNEPKSDGIA